MTTKSALIKNPGMVEKETELKKLRASYKRLLNRLEKEKAKLSELKENIVTTQRNSFAIISTKMEKIRELKVELAAAFEEVSKSKHVKRQEKKMFKELAKEVLDFDMFGDADMEETARQRYTDSEEHQRPPSAYFQEFAVKPEVETGQSIRKVFLRLATRFHPDKARTPEESKQMHDLMQRINEAYKRNDIAQLLEIEKQYAFDDAYPGANEADPMSWIQKQIDQLKQQITLLEDQVTRLKAESRKINRSDIGKMHKQFTSVRSPLNEMTDDFDHSIESLTLLRDGLREYARTGEMPDYLMQQMYPQEAFTIEFDLEDIAEVLWEMEQTEQASKRGTRRKRKK